MPHERTEEMGRLIRKSRRTVDKALTIGDKLEARSKDPSDANDPKWLLRHAKQTRAWANKRIKNKEHKEEERKKRPRISIHG